MKYAFDFLEQEFYDTYHECQKMEEAIVEQRYEDAGNDGRKALESMLERIFEIEHIKISPYNYKNKLDNELNVKLQNYNFKKIVDHSIRNKCHQIRKLGNKASHHRKLNSIFSEEDAKKIHELSYIVFKYFYEKYTNSLTFIKVPSYPGIIFEKEDPYDELIDKLMKGGYITSNKPIKKESWLEKYEFNPINGSYLLGELSKLTDSSKEAVEGSTSLNEFKQYMHVERGIQQELLNKLEEVSKKDGCNLILLCGSVGDGKSHLMAYLNQNYPDLMNNFKIWNDATESDDPQKTCIDTLSDLLINFSDDNINTSEEKLIISINLGVLSNFMDSSYAKKNYTKLSSILNSLNIFDVNDFSINYDEGPVSIISFSDYNLFEFDPNNNYKVSSKYLLDILNKITENNGENPFYVAYDKDIKNKINSPILLNYMMLSQSNVKEIIIVNLIKIIIKYKKIISTREIFNFIYEILVPSGNKVYDNEIPKSSYMDDLLPNLFFNTTNRCDILEIIHSEDPIIKRNDVTDEVLMKLNVSNDISKVLAEYCDEESITFLDEIFDLPYNLNDLGINEKKSIISTIIRFLNIFGNYNIKELFTKKSYLNYVNYLYNYNEGNYKELKTLYNDVEIAIFNWKGRLQNKYLCIDQIDSFKISKQFNLKTKVKKRSILSENNKNRFKTEINLYYSLDTLEEEVNLKLDYPLYELITKLNKGYKPNKKEQKDLILFNDFIDNLINLSTTNQFLIYHTKDDLSFELELDDFGEYIFNRV